MNFASDSGKLRILLVETEVNDYAAMRLLIMEIAPHQTDIFWSQAYAFALNDVRRKPLDLIMINFYLGRCRNGFALAEELRGRGCKLPIVLFGRSEALADLPLQWHFIGGLQTNKARKAAELFDCIHSIDRQELALKLNGSVTGRKLKVLIEVNLGGELSKSGVAPAGLDELASAIRDCPNLELAGLMTVPPYMEDVEEVRPFFRALRQKAEALGLPELSMGMSHDFEIAIEEGATMIRVGTALFGARA